LTGKYRSRSSYWKGMDSVDLEFPRGGKYRLEASLMDIAVPQTTELTIEAGGEVEQTVQVSVPEAALAFGKVVDSRGKPVNGANIEVFVGRKGVPSSSESFPRISVTMAYTGENGEFAFAGLPPGTHAVRVTGLFLGGKALETVIDVPANVVEMGPLNWVLTDPAVLNARVPFTAETEKYRYVPVLYDAAAGESVEADEVVRVDGSNLKLVGVPLKKLRVCLESPAYRTHPFAEDPYMLKWEPKAGEILSHDFSTLPLVTLSGRVRTGLRQPDGSPWVITEISFVRIGPEQNPVTVGLVYSTEKGVRVDEQGCFVARGMLPGRYIFQYTADGPQGGVRAVEFTLDTRQEQSVELELK
jgi:hypothetical protein